MKYSASIVLAYWASLGIPPAVSEHRFHPERKWRFDWAWTEYGLALEVQGGIFVKGRHSRGAAMLSEWEKLNSAATLGWRILFCQPRDLCTLDTSRTIKAALAACGWKPTA